jgi:hypothetical protein
MSETYYADSAYDSTCPRGLRGQKDVPQLSSAQRQLRRQPLPRDVHCGEFLAVSTMPRGLKRDKRMQGPEALHERYVVRGPKNPVILIELFTRVAAFFAMGGGQPRSSRLY